MALGRCCAWFVGVVVVLIATLLAHRATIDKSIMPVDLTGKTFVITGGTAGLGRMQAEILLRWNGTVVLGARNMKKATRVMEELRTVAGPQGKVDAHLMDLAELQTVRDFAAWFRERYPTGLDCLVNNAGTLGNENATHTKDGFEEVFQANYLGHFLLTMELMPSLRHAASGSSGEARVVHISSDAHYFGKVDLDRLQARAWTWWAGSFAGGQYPNAELMQVMFSNKLQRLLSDTNIVSNSLHPAAYLTAIAENEPWHHAAKFASWLVGWLRLDTTFGFVENAENAANMQTHVSTHPALGKVGGLYYTVTRAPLIDCGRHASECASATPNRQALSGELQDGLFRQSCKLSGYENLEACFQKF